MNDYSDYLNRPGMLDAIEKSWTEDCKDIHQHYADVVNKFSWKYNITSILEVGCSTGNVGLLIDKKSSYLGYIGIDKNEASIEIARKKGLFRLETMDIRDAYDYRLPGCLVISFAFLKHFGLHEWSEIFIKICSLGDYLIFNMPIAETTHDDGTEFHHVWMSMHDLIKQLDYNDFDVKEIDNINELEPIFICKRRDA